MSEIGHSHIELKGEVYHDDRNSKADIF
jgi:hypothetical protein